MSIQKKRTTGSGVYDSHLWYDYTTRVPNDSTHPTPKKKKGCIKPIKFF